MAESAKNQKQCMAKKRQGGNGGVKRSLPCLYQIAASRDAHGEAALFIANASTDRCWVIRPLIPYPKWTEIIEPPADVEAGDARRTLKHYTSRAKNAMSLVRKS